MKDITYAEKVWFTRGLLVGCAVSRSTIEYEELRRLTRVASQQMGQLLNDVRADLSPNDPDLTALVVSTTGRPGKGWGDISTWRSMARRVWQYWRDRTDLDNADFLAKYAVHATYPGQICEGGYGTFADRANPE